jgi:hypothetical protein
MIYADTPGPVNKTFLTVEPVVSIYIDMTEPVTNIYIPYLSSWDVEESEYTWKRVDDTEILRTDDTKIEVVE